jgi:hypothetical protein
MSMSRFNERFFARLDAAAERTGVPAVARGQARRRHFRWVPIVALAMASAGMIIGLVSVERVNAGYALIMLGFAIAVMLPIFGPVKPWGSPERVDEHRALRGRAMFAGFAAVSMAAFAGIWLVFGLAIVGDWPRLAILDQLRSLGFYLITLHSAVPTLHASWAIRPVDDD